MSNKRIFTIWVAGSTNFTDTAIAASSAAKFSAIKNNLEMEGIPGFFGEKLLKIALGLRDALAFGKSPALSQTVYMGVHGKSWMAKALRHNHTGGFMANPRQ